MANRPKINPKRTTLVMVRDPHTRGTCCEIPPQAQAGLEQIQLLTDGLLNATPSLAVVLVRAIETYRSRLANLLNEAAWIQTKEKVSEGQLLHFMERIQMEREALFLAACRPDARFDPKYGRCPSAEEITGHKLDIPELAKKIGIRLKALARKLVRGEVA